MTQSVEYAFFRVSKLAAIMFSLFVVSLASASLTVTPQDAILTTSLSPANTAGAISHIVGNVAGPINAELANLSREFLKPPTDTAGLTNTIANRVKPLPAAPAAILMVLIGFLCVSLVRDRRVWLTGLAGLLWLGYAGVHAVPRLALHLSHKNHSRQQLCAELSYPYYLENSHRLRCDVEGTQYIGLLHYLAGIPNASGAFTNTRLGALITFSQPRQKLYSKVLSYPYKNTYPFLSAIIPEQYSLNSLFKCLASKAKQFICFSPAFIFDELARGPPLITREKSFKL